MPLASELDLPHLAIEAPEMGVDPAPLFAAARLRGQGAQGCPVSARRAA